MCMCVCVFVIFHLLSFSQFSLVLHCLKSHFGLFCVYLYRCVCEWVCSCVCVDRVMGAFMCVYVYVFMIVERKKKEEEKWLAEEGVKGGRVRM